MIFESLTLRDVPLGISYVTNGISPFQTGVFTEIEQRGGEFVLRWEFPFTLPVDTPGSMAFTSMDNTVTLTGIDFCVIEEVPEFGLVDVAMSLLATA